MPVNFRIIPDHNLVHIAYSGTVTAQELSDEFTHCYQHPHYRGGMMEICDVSQVTSVDIGFGDMQNYSEQLQAYHITLQNPISVCMVGNSEITSLAVQMYESLAAANNVPAQLHQVAGYPEALTILNLPGNCLPLLPDFCNAESHLL